MKKYIVSTHAPVTTAQRQRLHDLGLNVHQSASNQLFQGQLFPEDVIKLGKISWIKHIEEAIEHDR